MDQVEVIVDGKHDTGLHLPWVMLWGLQSIWANQVKWSDSVLKEMH